jgi:cob(I)alamin adenosyltransferase
VAFPCDDEHDHGVATLIRELRRIRPRLLFLCTPANPTGCDTPYAALAAIADVCAAHDALLVLDQAYDAFSASPLGTPALPGHPAVLHLRSVTKDHALAGVRAAFAVGSREVIRAMECARIPWVASAAAQAAGCASMTDTAAAHVQRTVSILRAEAMRLMKGCSRLGLDTRPTSTHFFVVDVGNAPRVQATLLRDAGIWVRECTSFGLPAWIRVAARTPAENDVLLAALDAATPPLARPRDRPTAAAVVHNIELLTVPSSHMSIPTPRTDPLAPPETEPSATTRKVAVPKRKKPGPYRVPPRAQRHGLLIVNTGDGKGKTTAALGLLLRATGRGMSVGMFQFIKSAETRYGEHIAAERLGVEITPLGDGFTWLTENIADDRALAERGWARVQEILAAGTYDVLILDELTYCLTFGWLDEQAVIAAIRSRPAGTHVIVTGRDASPALIEAADLVTEMHLVKHPYREQGIAAQPGIEL